MRRRQPHPEGQPGLSSSDTPESSSRPAPKYYQLTHDYLVPSLRAWLTRKLRETRRGRAELRLAERTALWSGQPANRFLPPWWEWLVLRLLTRGRDWTTPQRTMMRRAAPPPRGVGPAPVRRPVAAPAGRPGGLRPASGPGLAGSPARGRDRGRAGHRARNGPVPALARRPAAHGLRRRPGQPRPAPTVARQPGPAAGGSGQLGYLRDRLLTAGPQEVLVIRQALRPHASEASPRLWDVLEDRKRLPGERLRAACALAVYARDDPRWQGVSRDVAERLVAEPGLVIARWAEALRPVRRHLLPPLAALLVEEGRDPAARRTITGLYGDYAQGLPDAFSDLEQEAAGEGGPAVDPGDLLAQPRRQANAASALAALARWPSAERLLRFTPDPTVRSYLIDRLGPGGAQAGALVALLETDVEVSVRRAALLALGEFDEDRLPLPERERLTARLAEMYRDDPDPGIHGAAGWLLGHWGQQSRLAETDRALATGRPEGARRWYVNARVQTWVLIPPGQFQRGPGKGGPSTRSITASPSRPGK